jgi:hypothetical protein
VIAGIVIDLISIPILLQRVTGLRVSEFLRKACVRPLAVFLLLGLVLVALKKLPHADHWPELILQGALAAVIAGVLVLAVGITSDERRRLVVQPLMRLKAKTFASHARS